MSLQWIEELYKRCDKYQSKTYGYGLPDDKSFSYTLKAVAFGWINKAQAYDFYIGFSEGLKNGK